LSDTDAKPPHRAPERRGRKRSPAGDVGHALRSAYDDTLKEAIPPEMLDLLGKLG
jgi:hypothetical protein